MSRDALMTKLSGNNQSMHIRDIAKYHPEMDTLTDKCTQTHGQTT